MPKVILRGGKQGQRVSRVVLEGSSENPIRYGDLNGEPFEVTDEEFAKLDVRYKLDPAHDTPDDYTEPPLPDVSEVEPEAPVEGDDNEDDET